METQEKIDLEIVPGTFGRCQTWVFFKKGED